MFTTELLGISAIRAAGGIGGIPAHAFSHGLGEAYSRQWDDARRIEDRR